MKIKNKQLIKKRYTMDIIKQKSEIGTYDFHITKDNKTLYRQYPKIKVTI